MKMHDSHLHKMVLGWHRFCYLITFLLFLCYNRLSLCLTQDNVTVEKLDLSGNWMEPAGAMYMAKLLHENDYITDLVWKEGERG